LSRLDVHKLRNLAYQLQKCFSFWGGAKLVPAKEQYQCYLAGKVTVGHASDSVICPRPPTGSMAYGREISSQCTFSSKECGSLYLYNRNENNKYFVYIMCLL